MRLAAPSMLHIALKLCTQFLKSTLKN